MILLLLLLLLPARVVFVECTCVYSQLRSPIVEEEEDQAAAAAREI